MKTFLLLALYGSAEAFMPASVGKVGVSKVTMQTTADKTVTPLPASVKPGVVTGKALVDLLDHAKENGYAIPAVNCVTSCGINACMEAAAKYGGPTMVQFSRGGGQFIAGKAANNDNDAA